MYNSCPYTSRNEIISHLSYMLNYEAHSSMKPTKDFCRLEEEGGGGERRRRKRFPAYLEYLII